MATAALPRPQTDRAVVWAVLALSAVGVVAVYSAVSFLAETKSGGDSAGLLFRHLLRIGAALGVGAHLVELRREAIGPFQAAEAFGLDAFDALRPDAAARPDDARRAATA